MSMNEHPSPPPLPLLLCRIKCKLMAGYIREEGAKNHLIMPFGTYRRDCNYRLCKDGRREDDDELLKSLKWLVGVDGCIRDEWL